LRKESRVTLCVFNKYTAYLASVRVELVEAQSRIVSFTGRPLWRHRRGDKNPRHRAIWEHFNEDIISVPRSLVLQFACERCKHGGGNSFGVMFICREDFSFLSVIWSRPGMGKISRAHIQTLYKISKKSFRVNMGNLKS
jgi:hypothetical protein